MGLHTFLFHRHLAQHKDITTNSNIVILKWVLTVKTEGVHLLETSNEIFEA